MFTSRPNVKRVCVAAALLLALSMPAEAWAFQAAPDSSPLQTSTVVPCKAEVVAILLLGEGDPRTTMGREFEVILRSPDEAGTASGSLWINASGAAYRVPFLSRATLSIHNQGRVDPISFRLPQDAVLESAFVDRFADSEQSSVCKLSTIWIPAYTKKLNPDLISKFKTAPASAPIEAEPISDPVRSCHFADFLPATLQAAPVRTPLSVSAGLPSQQVLVLLSLNADSSVRDVHIAKSPDSALNESALDAARNSIFRTKIHACQPVATSYIFIVVYQSR